MSHFLKVRTAGQVLAILDEIRPLPAETVSIAAAARRVAAAEIRAPEPVPHFARATMDGYAVRASDTFGASEGLPAMLETSGEVLIGESARVEVTPGKAVAIPTGGMLPKGADAVLMVEYTQALDSRTIEVTRPVAPGENVLARGDDIRRDETVFTRGSMLRPQDIGVLAALGIVEIEVFRRPKVALISTGDEIVPVSTSPLPPGKVRDINSFTLAAQMESAGAVVAMMTKVGDNLDELTSVCMAALRNHDVIVLSGGSSVGARDYTTRVLDRLPGSRLLVHGVAVRPGKPTILGLSGEKIFWGLPGQPVSALIICREFVVASLQVLQGLKPTERTGFAAGGFRAVLDRRLPSVHGRTDFLPVRVSADPSSPSGAPLAVPIFGKSGAISILARAHGYVIVPEHVEGYDRGTEVVVYPFSY